MITLRDTYLEYKNKYDRYIANKNAGTAAALRVRLRNLSGISENRIIALITIVVGLLNTNIAQAEIALENLNVALNGSIIPQVNNAIAIFNEPNDNYSDKLARIHRQLPTQLEGQNGGRRMTRSNRKRSMKLRFIY